MEAALFGDAGASPHPASSQGAPPVVEGDSAVEWDASASAPEATTDETAEAADAEEANGEAEPDVLDTPGAATVALKIFARTAGDAACKEFVRTLLAQENQSMREAALAALVSSEGAAEGAEITEENDQLGAEWVTVTAVHPSFMDSAQMVSSWASDCSGVRIDALRKLSSSSTTASSTPSQFEPLDQDSDDLSSWHIL